MTVDDATLGGLIEWARRHGRRRAAMAGLDVDELAQVAAIAAWEASTRYRPEAGCLWRFAGFRVRGAIKDHCRTETRRGLIGARCRADGPGEYAKVAGLESPIGEMAGTLGGLLPAPDDRAVDLVDIRDEARSLLSLLPAKERAIMAGLYGETPRTMKDLGEELGISESWVCYLHTRAMKQLRDHVAGLRPNAALAPSGPVRFTDRGKFRRALAELGGEATAQDIAARLGMSSEAARLSLRRSCERGDVVRGGIDEMGRRVYRLVRHAKGGAA